MGASVQTVPTLVKLVQTIPLNVLLVDTRLQEEKKIPHVDVNQAMQKTLPIKFVLKWDVQLLVQNVGYLEEYPSLQCVPYVPKGNIPMEQYVYPVTAVLNVMNQEDVSTVHLINT